jgi:hypothetical protein
MNIVGVDFSSSPTRRKPIVLAQTRLEFDSPQSMSEACLRLEGFERLESLDEFSLCIQRPGPWLGGFDFPFALPRELLQSLGWPPFTAPWSDASAWVQHIEHLNGLSRAQLVAAFREFCGARPVGGKFAHRACDVPAGASPSMKWVNPPVAFMLHAGATRLHAAGVTIPGLKLGDPQRIALEAYPGHLARRVLGRTSYKSDDRQKQDVSRAAARKHLVATLEGTDLAEIGLAQARDFKLRLTLSKESRALCLGDASGDHLDAWLCAVQAALGALWQRRDASSLYGMAPIDPLEGWIVSVAR